MTFNNTECCALAKDTIFDVGEAFWKDDFLEFCATFESIIVYISYAVGNGDAFEICTIHKCLIADTGELVWKRDVFESRTALESISFNGGEIV